MLLNTLILFSLLFLHRDSPEFVLITVSFLNFLKNFQLEDNWLKMLSWFLPCGNADQLQAGTHVPPPRASSPLPALPSWSSQSSRPSPLGCRAAHQWPVLHVTVCMRQLLSQSALPPYCRIFSFVLQLLNPRYGFIRIHIKAKQNRKSHFKLWCLPSLKKSGKRVNPGLHFWRRQPLGLLIFIVALKVYQLPSDLLHAFVFLIRPLQAFACVIPVLQTFFFWTLIHLK